MPDEKRQTKLFTESDRRTGALIDTEIGDAVSRGQLIARDTYAPACMEASSYDIRVGLKGILGGGGTELNLQKDALELTPGSYAGVISLERLMLPPDVCARIGSKRALSYDGVILLTGSIVDPGYDGHLLFGLYNASQRRVLIRHGRKICNIVFERLFEPPEKQAPSDPDLRSGNFPDAFVDRMANMEVLPWMQISERVKQIEQITKDILDLKARYDDVLQPIRDLTENVQSLTQDVTNLTTETRGIAGDVGDLNRLVGENSRQVTELTTNLAKIIGQVGGIQEQTRGLVASGQTQAERITNLQTSFGRYQVLVYILWALLLLAGGSLLPALLKKLSG
jgi:deoxycytidine triphosphate deaminase